MQFILAIVALLAGAEGQPNIVVVMADDLGLGDVACYGGTMALTPRLDRMAREGLKFNHYYSASPICSPSRAGLLTGTFPARWRLTSYLQTRAGNAGCGQADFLDPQAPTLPRLLKQAGYATAHIGKWHLGGGRDVVNAPPFAAYGYDHHASTYESPQPHPDITATPWVWSDKDRVKRWDRTAFFVDQTVEFLGKQSTKPGFVFLWLDDPHSPWVPDAEKPRKDTPASLRRVLENMDFQIGRLLDRLDAMPQGKNTLVLFISDNGPRPSYQGKRTMGLRGEKLSLYEGGIRLPCLVRWPGVIAPGGVDDSTVLSAVDMLPTLAAAAGAQVGNVNALDGENQIGAFRGQPRVRSRPLFWEYGRNDKYFDYPVAATDRSGPLAMREGHYKLLCKPDGTGAELFNLAMDPKEQSNIAETQNEIATSMKAKLLAWWRSL